jgi:hypothetical protein
MSLLLALILTHLLAMSVSALPTVALPDSMWDMQRSTNYKLIYDAAMVKYAEDNKPKTEPTIIETRITPAKNIKRRAVRVTKAPEMKSVPMPGMQCAVM